MRTRVITQDCLAPRVLLDFDAMMTCQCINGGAVSHKNQGNAYEISLNLL